MPPRRWNLTIAAAVGAIIVAGLSTLNPILGNPEITNPLLATPFAAASSGAAVGTLVALIRNRLATGRSKDPR